MLALTESEALLSLLGDLTPPLPSVVQNYNSPGGLTIKIFLGREEKNKEGKQLNI